MQVTETLSDGLKRGFTIVVPAADIEDRRSRRLADLGKTLRIPGFRPGKVPPQIVRQRYGTAVTAEVLEQSVDDATRQVFTDRGLRPAMQPKIDVVSDDPGPNEATDLEFKVEVEILPEITLPDFSTISLTRLKAEVSPDAVDKALADIAARNRDLADIPAEELATRGAEKGEVLTVDYAGQIEGQPFPGGTGSDTDVEIGGSGFIAGFAEQLEGMKPGEQRTVEVTFPAGYFNKDLAGKTASFDVTAKRLRRKLEQPVNDKLAEKTGFGDLAELRDFVTSRIQREYDAASRLRLKRVLLDQLAERASFTAPEGMVDREFGHIWRRLEEARTQGQLDEEDRDKDEETLRAEYRGIAERRVRLGLLLAEIGTVNNIRVTNEELSRAIRMEAARYPGQEMQILEMYQKYPAMAGALQGPILEDKVVDYVLELVKLTEETVPPETLLEEPDQASKPDGGAAAEAAAPAGAAENTAESEHTQPQGQSSGEDAPAG